MSLNEHEPRWSSELDKATLEAINQIRDDDPSEADVQSTLANVVTLIDRRESIVDVFPNSNKPKMNRSTQRLFVKLGWLGLAAVVLMVIGVTLMLSKPKLSLAAQIAQSVASQDWVRAIEKYSEGGGEFETWHNATMDLSARVDETSIEFRDHVSGEFHVFSRAEKTVYRVSESDFPIRYNELSNLATRLPVLLGNELPDDPIDEIPMLKKFGSEVSFIGHQLVPSENGSSIEYAIQFLYREKPAEIVFQVDADSLLPQSCEAVLHIEGKEIVWSARFEYPDAGPRSVYDLGVPVDAKLVNRVESEKARFLLQAVKAGAEHFDDYRAISVRYSETDKFWWSNADVEILCRKGICFTRSFCNFPFRREDRKTVPPQQEPDLESWWKKRISEKQWDGYGPNGRLSSLRIGDQEWKVDSEDGSYEKYRFTSTEPGFSSLLPEYTARPSMGGSARNFEIRVDEKPVSGPQGTILFELIQTIHPDVKPLKHVGDSEPAAGWRYWIDPERGYLVVRLELVGSDGSWFDCTIVEEAAKSPKGIWYPTQTLRKSIRPDGSINQETTKFYVDFKAEVPDEHFRVPN